MPPKSGYKAPRAKKPPAKQAAAKPPVPPSESDSDSPPMRQPQCCDLVFTTLAPHILDLYLFEIQPLKPGGRVQSLCAKCGWKVAEHNISPARAPSVAVASATATPPVPSTSSSPNDKKEVIAPGPQASLALTAESPLTFLGVIQAWKNSTWCVDDSDVVQSKLEEISAAWVRGSYNIVRRYFVVTGSNDDIHRTFSYKPIPADVADPIAFRQERGTAVLGCVTLANAVLDVAVAYARKRCVIDKVANQVATIEELRTDEWYALLETRKGKPAVRTGELEPDPEDFEGPHKVLWWFLFVASLSTLVIQTRLERAVRDFGALYRSKHAEAFKPKAIWQAKFSAEAVAARRAALRAASAPAIPQKRQREQSVPPVPRPGAAAAAQPRVPSKRALKRQKWLDAKAARQAAEAGGGAAAATAADDEDDDDGLNLPPIPHSAPNARSGSIPSVYGASVSPGGGSSAGRGRGGRGDRGGRGRGGRRGGRRG